MAAKKKAEERESVHSKRKAEGSEAPTRDDRALALMEDINKKMRGRAILMNASEYHLPWYTKRLPTGLLTVDLALMGGFPAGGLSQIIGRRSAGKSLLMWLVIRQLQHILGNKMRVLLAMTEIPADRGQARSLGVQISMGDADIREVNKARRQNGWPEFTKEEVAFLRQEVGTIHELHATTAEDFYDVILRCVEEDIYHLVVIDSIGNALAANEQANESVHDKTYGGTSAPNTTFIKKLTNLLTMKTEHGEVRDTCVIGINQVRDNLKDPDRPYKAPGGNALEHAKLVDLYVESGTLYGSEVPVYTVTKDGPKTSQRFVATAKQINWRIEKGKAGMHDGARGSYVFDYRINNVDFYTDMLVAGVGHEVIEASGAWLGIPHPSGKKDEYLLRANGKDKFIAALAADAQAKAATDEESLMEYIRDACFKKAGINISYEWEDKR